MMEAPAFRTGKRGRTAGAEFVLVLLVESHVLFPSPTYVLLLASMYLYRLYNR